MSKKFIPSARLIFPTVFVEQLSYNEKLELLCKKLAEAYEKINELEDRVEALEEGNIHQ
jgi:hypothetical protein